MTANPSAHRIDAIEDAELAAVQGGASIRTVPVEPIITPQMIENFHISQYFVPQIRIVPRG